MEVDLRQRRPHGQVRAAMADFLRDRGETATIAEIQRAAEERLGGAIPKSSVRGGLQDERLFERVRRGAFRLRG